LAIPKHRELTSKASPLIFWCAKRNGASRLAFAYLFALRLALRTFIRS
jgi:hypothetical protein